MSAVDEREQEQLKTVRLKLTDSNEKRGPNLGMDARWPHIEDPCRASVGGCAPELVSLELRFV